jgi:hypothetical protein
LEQSGMDDFIKNLLEAGMNMSDLTEHAYEYAKDLYAEGRIRQKYGRADIMMRIAELMKGSR